MKWYQVEEWDEWYGCMVTNTVFEDDWTPLEQEFLRRLYIGPDGCWSDTCTDYNDRYGRFRGQLAHRWAYEHFCGPIPLGREIHHTCRNSRCVNPDHLIAVTKSQHRTLHRIYDDAESSVRKLKQINKLRDHVGLGEDQIFTDVTDTHVKVGQRA